MLNVLAFLNLILDSGVGKFSHRATYMLLGIETERGNVLHEAQSRSTRGHAFTRPIMLLPIAVHCPLPKRSGDRILLFKRANPVIDWRR